MEKPHRYKRNMLRNSSCKISVTAILPLGVLLKLWYYKRREQKWCNTLGRDYKMSTSKFLSCQLPNISVLWRALWPFSSAFLLSPSPSTTTNGHPQFVIGFGLMRYIIFQSKKMTRFVRSRSACQPITRAGESAIRIVVKRNWKKKRRNGV